jgi:HEAT repeat protein
VGRLSRLFGPNVDRLAAAGDDVKLAEIVAAARYETPTRLAALHALARPPYYPARLSALGSALEDVDAQVRTAAAEALARLPGGMGVWSLMHALFSSNEATRATAARGLALVSGTTAAEGLLAFPPPADRAGTAAALGVLRDPAGIGFLAGALADESEAVREAARAGLLAIGGDAVAGALVGAMRSHDARLSEEAVLLLLRLNPPLPADDWAVFLLLAAAYRSPAYRRTLVAIGEGAVGPVRAYLERGNAPAHVASEAIRALAEIGGRSAMDALAGTAQLGSSAAAEAIEALAEAGDARALDVLATAAGEPSPARARWAVERLARLGADSFEPLVAALGHEADGVRIAAIEALAALGDERAAAPLVARASDPDETTEVRLAALQALAGLGALDQAVSGLTALLDEPRAAQHAALALASLRASEAAEPLLRWLFREPHEIGSLAEIAAARPFGECTDLVLAASGYACEEREQSFEPSGDDRSYTYEYSLEGGDEAVASLCALRTPASSNLLRLVAEKKDVEVTTYTQYPYDEESRATLSFADQRGRAWEELRARGDPPYDPAHYLREGAWRLA